jgi:hypothetical protein
MTGLDLVDGIVEYCDRIARSRIRPRPDLVYPLLHAFEEFSRKLRPIEGRLLYLRNYAPEVGALIRWNDLTGIASDMWER